ncbi:PHB depolymerase family esterase [Frankia sp. R82]|uniref:extracellular catalytic domain type 1 short-chain-length polyhydroxyalkanoate depolymerase n=1 Tax=Frankia sp. R82 TaxID=2950553 RepID=UPI002043CB7D|nr:PHB depolymerase family esterase [Frankia sp. R82]MCM3886630.1 polyhydroxybutyrate depolymerase [Frankia sp. R82]
MMLVLAGCGSSSTGVPAAASTTSAGTQAIPPGSSTQTLTVGGVTRTFHLYRPAAMAGPAPLVVMLHGGYGSGGQAEKSYGWDSEADRGHFLVAYPDGLTRAWNVGGGGCCGKPARDNVDDLAFLTRMVATLEHETPIDPRRVYATGISNGGIMAYTLACKTQIFAAIGPDSATELAACPSPAPLSVIHIHGTADIRIPYNGGPGHNRDATIDGPAVPTLNAAWLRTDHCATPTITTAGVVTTSEATCADHRGVELITIAGAGHQWPGAKPNVVVQKLLNSDPPSTALNATQLIWRFFSTHPKP